MTTCDPLLQRKQQILGRIESTCGTSETLTADDGKARIIVGAANEYAAPREKRDLARSSLTPIGNLESTKANNISFQSEVNTPDTFSVLAALDVDTIDWQSGNTIRYTFNGTPDLSSIVAGDYLTVNYATNLSNSGTFLIETVNDGSDYVDVINRDRDDATDDEATDSPAVADIQENLDVQWAYNAAGMEVLGASRVGIGAITSGPFVRGETITGAGGGTGRLIKGEVTGAAYVYFEPTSVLPILTTEVITGGTSGATATTSGAPAVYGYHVKPISDNQEAATVELQQDGYAWSARGAMANLVIEAAANRAGFNNFEFQGPKLTNGDKAMTSVTRDNEDPPILKNAELTLAGTFTPVFRNFSFDIANTISLRENGNASDGTGFEVARITAREPKVTINLEHELAATFDFFAKLDAGTKTSLSLHLGDTLGKQMFFFADELEFDSLPTEDQDGIVGIALEALCTGDLTSSEDEFELLFI
jgi:hypothetical protein